MKNLYDYDQDTNEAENLKEWKLLIMEAKKIGLTMEEVRDFIQKQRQNR